MSLWDLQYSMPEDKSAARAVNTEDRLRALELAVSSNVDNHRNLLVNGNMSVFQRNANHTAAGLAFTMDRWHSYLPVTGRTISRVTSVSEGARYWMRVARDSGNAATNAVTFGQTLETQDSVRLQGKYVALSFRAIKYANWSPSWLNATVFAGTGTDQPSRIQAAFTGDTTVATQNFALATTGRYVVVGLVPANATQLAVVFTTAPFVGTAGAADCIDITDIQLEEGTRATPFEHRHHSAELAMCQRYFQRHVEPPLVGVASNVANSGVARANCALPVEMRVAPSATLTGTVNTFDGLNVGTATGIAANFCSTKRMQLDFNGHTIAALAAAVPRPISCYTSSGWYIDLSAEL